MELNISTHVRKKQILNLIASASTQTEQPAFIDHAVDRLGGRAYYNEILGQRFGCSVDTMIEDKGSSRYQLQTKPQQNIGFYVKGEDKNPLIAAASCLAKYARELHMLLLNRYWSGRYPWLKGTAGYPQDAKRWLFQLGRGNTEAYKEALILGEIPDSLTKT